VGDAADAAALGPDRVQQPTVLVESASTKRGRSAVAVIVRA
jgi:hypothetical protein